MSQQSLQSQINADSLAGFVELEFDLPQALLEKLVEVFDKISSVPLNEINVGAIPEEQGVYQLYLDDELVYVGKTDAEAGLRNRLYRHACKIKHRLNLEPARVTLKAVRIYVFTAMDLESELIRHYGGVKNLAWNGSGFGSNDPGRERDTTKVKATNYDALFPIDVDREVELEISEGQSAADVIVSLKATLPYTLRFESDGKSRRPHSDFGRAILPSLPAPSTTRTILSHIVKNLPDGWHATALPGYVIVYKNDRRSFPSGSIIAKTPRPTRPAT